MSKDTIYRADAIKAIHREARIAGGSVAIEYADMFQDAIETLPSADRPQGEWIEQEGCWQCSECGDEYVLEIGVKPIDARMHYCPNCGCRMKGADDEV